uniref:Uncharacterized protein n=1 Tax=Oryza glumipatula TaxID=40148 RepID=A0A0D9YW59_9ORYZ
MANSVQQSVLLMQLEHFGAATIHVSSIALVLAHRSYSAGACIWTEQRATPSPRRVSSAGGGNGAPVHNLVAFRLTIFLSTVSLRSSPLLILSVRLKKKKTVSGGRTGGGSASVLLLRDTDSPPSRARPASRAGGAVRTGCCSPSPTPYRTSILPCAAGRRASRFESKYRIEAFVVKALNRNQSSMSKR